MKDLLNNYKLPDACLIGKQAKESAESDQSLELKRQIIESVLQLRGVMTEVAPVGECDSYSKFSIIPMREQSSTKIQKSKEIFKQIFESEALDIVAPIPGKKAWTMEIPSKDLAPASLCAMASSLSFTYRKSPITVCIGKGTDGEDIFLELDRMPHLIIGGAYSSGVRDFTRSVVSSVLFGATPDEAKLVLIDLGYGDLERFEGVPHLLCPPISDEKEALGALDMLVSEMDRRYTLLRERSVRNIDMYNSIAKESGEPTLPKIVVVIDELDRMIHNFKEDCERLIVTIAQKARAAGIHLVIATERPTEYVLTPIVRVNIPTRISLKTKSSIDSQILIDSRGAENLAEGGDAYLYSPIINAYKQRVRLAYIGDDELDALISHTKSFDYVCDCSDVLEDIKARGEKFIAVTEKKVEYDEDSYLGSKQFLDAVELAFSTGGISTSIIQRKLSIGYGKAAKFIDVMEEMGIVSEFDSYKPRKLLITREDWQKILEKLAPSEN